MDEANHPYVTVYGYKVRDGGAHADTPVVLGKLIVPNVEYGWPDGPRVYTRREPVDVALFHNEGAFSIDERAQLQWERDLVDIIQFIDKPTGISWLILRALWLQKAERDRHGAGWQAYVNLENFERYEHPVYDDGHYNRAVKWLEPLPRTHWDNLPVPQVPVAKALRRVQDGQLSLLP